MTRTQIGASVAAAVVAATIALAPVASAQDQYSREYHRRQQTKNEWRNLAIGGGALGLLGLVKKDSTLTFAGTAGGLYSLYRYEQDRKSQSRTARARAEMFRRGEYRRNGHRYVRRSVTRDGKRYYQFVRRD